MMLPHNLLYHKQFKITQDGTIERHRLSLYVVMDSDPERKQFKLQGTRGGCAKLYLEKTHDSRVG